MSGDMAEAGSTPITPEEPLPDVAYAYDGTLEGLLSAVFEAYERREDPQEAPGPPLSPGKGEPRHHNDQIDDCHTHHLEKAAAGPLGIADVPSGQVFRSAKETSGLHRQEQRVQQNQRREDQGEGQRLRRGGAVLSFQRHRVAEAV